MKINICSKLKEGAWGGGNQFLKALRIEFLRLGVYTESPKEAQILIFNSYQDLCCLIWSKFIYRNRKFVYRLGPIFYFHRGWKWKIVDWLVIKTGNLCADLIVFQSEWSYRQALRLGFNSEKKYSIILNAVDDKIFFKNPTVSCSVIKPIKLIYTSWSNNPNKGFSYLKFLDKNLDFKKYQMEFVGNSPISFDNIKIVKPLTSHELAKELRESDIFISPAKDDACSNAILEALSCGLPVIALDSGANAELVKKGGVLFNNNDQMIKGIDLVAADLQKYRSDISTERITDVTHKYLVAIKNLHDSIEPN